MPLLQFPHTPAPNLSSNPTTMQHGQLLPGNCYADPLVRMMRFLVLLIVKPTGRRVVPDVPSMRIETVVNL